MTLLLLTYCNYYVLNSSTILPALTILAKNIDVDSAGSIPRIINSIQFSLRGFDIQFRFSRDIYSYSKMTN